ncbi:hypothetical protein JL722_7923 [Aureococcus anophagefferens]|nr:hypothetical protein JL722_7923 [Aureococcus anophagefferens]
MYVMRRGRPARQDSALRVAEDDDARSVGDVVAAAAARIGEADGVAAAVVAALEAQGVTWAWQLALATDGDFAACGAPMGLKLTIKAELRGQGDDWDEDDVPARVRAFLLPDGGVAGAAPLHLRNVRVDRGLIMGIPFALLRDNGAPADGRDTWTAWRASSDDVRDAIAMFVFFSMLFVVFLAVMLGMLAATAGGDAGLKGAKFYEGAVNVVGVMFVMFMSGGIYPLMGLFEWKVVTAARSPNPSVVAIAFFCATSFGLANHVFLKFVIDALPLELYHQPSWMRTLGMLHNPQLASQMTLAALEPRAKRAAQLLAGCAFAKRPSPPPRRPRPSSPPRSPTPPTERAVDDAPACCLLPVRRP